MAGQARSSTGNRHVLITGASTGIGRACALHLARVGFRVTAGVRQEASGEALKAEAASAGAGEVRPLHLDVTDAASVAAAAKSVAEAVGDDGLCGLVNNAGIGVGGPAEFVPLDAWRRQFEVNVFGQVAVTQAMLPLLRAYAARAGKGRARVVMMSSIAGRVAVPIAAPYAASKFALEAISDSLRLELRPQGIRVCLIEPGAIDTPIWKKDEWSVAALPPEARTLYGATIDAFLAATRQAAGGAIPPQRVAEAVARCLTRRVPRIRSVVGWDARLGSWFKGRIPDRLFDAAMARAMKFPT